MPEAFLEVVAVFDGENDMVEIVRAGQVQQPLVIPTEEASATPDSAERAEQSNVAGSRLDKACLAVVDVAPEAQIAAAVVQLLGQLLVPLQYQKARHLVVAGLGSTIPLKPSREVLVLIPCTFCRQALRYQGIAFFRVWWSFHWGSFLWGGFGRQIGRRANAGAVFSTYSHLSRNRGPRPQACGAALARPAAPGWRQFPPRPPLERAFNEHACST